MLFKGHQTPIRIDNGGFIVHVNLPGWVDPKSRDHGHGPLAMIARSILVPGRMIAMHEHRNDEIISWVPDGVMRHDDREGGELLVDSGSFMVMNAGRSFWHAEATLPTDPMLDMLQILVRPDALDLAPGIQFGPIAPPQRNVWRHLVGPEGGEAPFFVRNRIDFFDLRQDAGVRTDFPEIPGRDLYFYVFSGAITVDGRSFSDAEQGLRVGAERLSLIAEAPSVIVAFLIDPNATITREGTVGDARRLPPTFVFRALQLWQRLRTRRRRVRT